jgi:hypothetical protein
MKRGVARGSGQSMRKTADAGNSPSWFQSGRIKQFFEIFE